jgi:hypothetical protein
MKIEHENLADGQHVYAAWVAITHGAREAKVYIEPGVVVNAEARLVRFAKGGLRQIFSFEQTYTDEIDAHAAVASELEAAAERVAAVARGYREQAAALAAKAQVTYA